MKKILVKNQVEGGKVAFELLKESLTAGAQTLGLATGSSPIALYQEMVESDVDFSELYSVNLDEYVGLSPEHEQSYHAFMKAQLFDAKPFKESFLPDGMAEDLEKAAKDYDDVLAQHVIDLQILGIGSNGHIGFNEPGTPFDSQTHVVDLTDTLPFSVNCSTRRPRGILLRTVDEKSKSCAEASCLQISQLDKYACFSLPI